MMDTIIVLLVVITLICALSFMVQFGVFLWLFYRGISNAVIFEVEKIKAGKVRHSQDIATEERSSVGQVVNEDEKNGDDK